jgi:hypothetical protein
MPHMSRGMIDMFVSDLARVVETVRVSGKRITQNK